MHDGFYDELIGRLQRSLIVLVEFMIRVFLKLFYFLRMLNSAKLLTVTKLILYSVQLSIFFLVLPDSDVFGYLFEDAFGSITNVLRRWANAIWFGWLVVMMVSIAKVFDNVLRFSFDFLMSWLHPFFVVTRWNCIQKSLSGFQTIYLILEMIFVFGEIRIFRI